MAIKFKKSIKKIFLISGFLICLLGFNSYAANFFCNNCGQFVVSGDRNSAWLIHNRNANGSGFNPVTKQRCKQANLVSFSSEVEKIYKENQQKLQDLLDKDPEQLQKLQIVNSHQALVTYISEIFTVNDALNRDDDTSKNNVFSTYNLMKNITLISIETLQKFNNSGAYVLFCFVGMLFCIINYCINFFQNSYNSDGRTLEQYIKIAIQLIFSIFIICTISRISEFFLIFFRYILDYIWNFTKEGSLMVEEVNKNIEIGTYAQNIAYNILVGEKLTATDDDTLAITLQAVPYGLLCIKFFIPYIISVIGKFGILFAIMNNCVDVLVHCFLFPIAAGDVNENLRQSKLIKYSKHIFAGALNLSVIVLILLVCQVLSSSFINFLIDQATAGGDSSSVNYFEVSFIMAVLQVVKVVACNSVAKQISGHVAGE